VQFIQLQARWQAMRISVSAQLAKDWVKFSLVFLFLLMGLVLLLPTNYALGFLDLLGYALGFVLRLFIFVLQFVWLLLFFLIGLLLWPFRQSSGDAPTRFTPPQLEIEPPAYPEGLSPPWVEVLRSFFFWGVFLGVLVFAFVQYARQHEGVIAVVRGLAIYRWGHQFWRWLRKLFRGVNQRVSSAVTTGMARLRLIVEADRAGGPARLIHLGSLSPRRQIYFFFLAMLRRGREHGIPRKPWQTPYEYAATLKGELEEANEQIGDLTDSYVEARYSRHKVEVKHANLARWSWVRVRRALRSVGRKPDQS
jgi:hypothetical protein